MPSGIYIRTAEHKEKIRLSCLGINTGKKLAEHRKKISEAKMGAYGPNTNRKLSLEWRNNISKSLKAYKAQNPPSIVRPKVNKLTVRIRKSRATKTKVELLERKRFRNQRYKVSKRNAGGKHTFEEWLILKCFYKNMCLCCKQFEPEIKLSEDHIIPLSMGGSDNIDNIQPLCVACNTRKHAKALQYLTFGINGSLTAPPNTEGRERDNK